LVTLDDETRQRLAARGITIEEAPISRIDGLADVVLTNGRTLSFAGLFVASRTEPASALAAASGCELEETPMGVQVRVSDAGETTVRGIFACGDTSRTPHSVSLAVGSGAFAGAQVHRSLLWPG
jgi:thioredoxin reductase